MQSLAILMSVSFTDIKIDHVLHLPMLSKNHDLTSEIKCIVYCGLSLKVIHLTNEHHNDVQMKK